MINKKELLQFIINELSKKQLFLQQELKALSESLANSTKSSAGDKHETETAMNQLEQEQLTRQLLALRHQQQLVQQLNPQVKHTRITTGSLVKTSKAVFFISVGVGKISCEGQEVFCINLESPIGRQLYKKSVTEKIHFGEEEQVILEIS